MEDKNLEQVTLADCELLYTVGIETICNDGKVMGFIQKGTPQTQNQTAFGKSN